MDDKDFIDVSDEVETLSFDDEISDEIDAMLSQIMPEEKKPSSNYEILKDEKVTNKNSLDVYVPSIKDFNIKSERTHKIVKKVMIYSIIFILFTFEFFINKGNRSSPFYDYLPFKSLLYFLPPELGSLPTILLVLLISVA